MPRVINVHTHFQPSGIEEALIPHGLAWITNPDGSHTFTAGAIEYRMPPTKPRQAGFYGAELHTRIPYMDEEGVDVHLLSASPMMFGYHLDPGSAVEVARIFNDALAADIARFPDRFWGAAQLPMQDPEAATRELERAVRELGLVSCSVGWSFGPTRTLGHPDYDGLLAKAVELDVPVMIHPVALGQSTDLVAGGADWLTEYDLDSLWGYIYVETAAVVGMIFSGALDRHPDLRLFVPHGGGMIPYHVGRVEQYASFTRQHPDRVQLQRSIPEYLEQFYFDTIVHDPRGMKLLIDVMGADNVVLGTNWSGWDDAPLWDVIRELDGVSDEAKDRILGLNATERLYRASAAAV
jgi:aminocarboxymuconate-semialdehyde decarboxylase